MSGGIDSSVAAALLLESGYDVIGLMLRLWSDQGKESYNRCCNPDSISAARKVAAHLNIPFYVVDAKNEFRRRVVQYFIEGYSQGNTPNPCISCNRNIRWGLLFDKMQHIGADFFATGHYARIVYQNGEYSLLRGIDADKDQSYVLHVLSQYKLSKTILPLGKFNKIEVRRFAVEFNLPVHNRKESQDLCFLGDESYQSFLLRHAPEVQNTGLILSPNGEVIGEHHGLAFYTIGQRRGLGISAPEPLYVSEKRIQDNTIVLGSRESLDVYEFYAEEVNWISGNHEKNEFTCSVQTRYRTKSVPCTVTILSGKEIHVHLSEPIKGVAPGQAAVFYQDDICMGGGIIRK